MNKHSFIQALVSLLIILALFTSSALIVSPVASAGVIHVNTFTDEDIDNQFCSLREAVEAANSGNDYYGCTGAAAGANTIILQAGTYTLSLNHHLNINSQISILGEGAAETSIQAATCNPISNGCDHTHRVFFVSHNGELILNGVTLKHGNPSAGSGGAIFSYGDLTIENSTLSANRALFGGGIYLQDSHSTLTLDNVLISGNSAAHQGGGIYVQSCESTTITGNSKILGNTAGSSGGGISNSDCTLTISNSEISGNSAASGGGLFNQGLLTHIDVTVLANNTSSGVGGGIRNTGTITLTNSALAGNSSDTNGGGINTSGTLDLSNTNIENNSAQQYGGGIYNQSGFSMAGGHITENTAKWHGGGIYIVGWGPTLPAHTTLTNTTISGNQAEEINGGGIYNSGYSTLTVYGSTIANNSADFEGGGLFNGVTNSVGSESNFINSTFSGNTADVNGGAVMNRDGILQLTHCTIYSNSSYGTTGGVYNEGQNSELRIRNTIIAGSANYDCYNQSSAIMENTTSLVQDHLGCFDPSISSDPMLTTLGDFGGPTHTHALRPNSPAINTANPDYCEAFDQRGIERPQGAGCDIGAFERDQVDIYIFLPLILR